jgi:hypothetical protein
MTSFGAISATVILTEIARLTPIHTEVKDRYRKVDGYVPEWVDNYVNLLSTIRYRAIKAPDTLTIEDADQVAAVESGLRRDLRILTVMEGAAKAMEPTA